MAKPLKMLLKVVAGLIWVYSYLSLGFFMAIAAVPGFLLGKWGWDQEVSWSWMGPAADLADPLIGLYWSIIGFFVFGLSLMVVLPLVRFIMRYILWWKPHVGEIPVYSFRIWFWYNLSLIHI